jgi:outer membrane biogenesis lipoprotein LolB
MFKLISLCSVLMLLTACSTVEPWERGTLAKDVMAWQPDSLKASLDSHISFSKEGTAGGGRAAGGGCGCN